MRLSLVALSVTLAVLCIGAGVRSETRMSRCMDRPVAVEFASFGARALASELGSDPWSSKLGGAEVRAVTETPSGVALAASVILEARPKHPLQEPGQSRAPITCDSPDQPGCQVSAPQSPSHRSTLGLSYDAATAAPELPEPPPASVTCVVYGPAWEGTPGEAHVRLPWRPPSA